MEMFTDAVFVPATVYTRNNNNKKVEENIHTQDRHMDTGTVNWAAENSKLYRSTVRVHNNRIWTCSHRGHDGGGDDSPTTGAWRH